MPSRANIKKRRKAASDDRFRMRAGGGTLPPLPGRINLAGLNEVVKPQNLFLKEDIFKLEEYGLPNSLAHELSRNGIRFVWGLVEKTKEKLLELPGFGKARLNKIVQVLAGVKLELRK